MVEITVKYVGDLSCEAKHGPSGCEVTTDAPVDNQGRGLSFSPTDLVATALASCMATILGIAARREGWALEGMRLRVEKHMAASGPRRIARLPVDIWMPIALPHAQRVEVERLARTCPVHQSVHPDIEIPLTIHWPDAGE